MIWSLILPAQLAVLITGIVMLVTFLICLSKSRSMVTTFTIPVGTGIMAIVPVFFITWPIVDYFRFGDFQYNAVDQIGEPLVKSFFPPDAKDILLYSRTNKLTAWYRTEEESIRRKVDKLWKKRKSNRATPYVNFQNGRIQKGKKFQETSDQALKDNILVLETPIDSGGGPFIIYFDKKNKIAYHDHLYW